MDSKIRLRLITGFRIFTSLISLILFSYSSLQGLYKNNLVIIVMLFIANIVIIAAQKDNQSSRFAFLLWLVEVVGIVSILWFTGGIYSLYFWLIFNPMLMMVYKELRVLIIRHIFFIGAVFFLAIYAPEVDYVNHKVQMLIGVIVIVVYSYIIGAIYEDQYKTNQRLLCTTKKLSDLSQKYAALNDCIIEFVTVLGRIVLVEKYDTILEAFKDYVKIVFKDDGFFASRKGDAVELYCEANPRKCKLIQDAVLQLENDTDDIQSIEVLDQHFFYFFMRHAAHEHIIGCFVDGDTHDYEIAKKQLLFLRQLYQLALNKLNVYALNRELLIKNEQNRIAEEIHDGVNQELFAISCQLYNIKQKAVQGFAEDELTERLDQVYGMIKTTNRDLKDIVYRMSRAKTTAVSLVSKLARFIDQMSFLYGIEIVYDIDECIIDTCESIQRSILRILNETISNAVRHGGATKIDIKIVKEKNKVSVVVKDNGSGMQLREIENDISGIGLKNLKHMADSHGGKVDIISGEKGTTIDVSMLQGIAV
ncbi:MAG: hypothetical protein CSA13_01865 [Clostridiales bacterium]|nr:MAG: hypothetical protein CSA13_01865 [Clostridiales bacterium]